MAQSITGTVVNDSGNVVNGAYIKITGRQDKLVLNALSDEQGHFSFTNLKGNDSTFNI